MLTELDLGVGVIAPAGTLVKPPTSNVPPPVWMSGTRPPDERLVGMAENGANSTVPAFVVIELGVGPVGSRTL